MGLVIICCVCCFLAGVMNGSGGSGGLISVPSFMLCGLDSHWAIGTNKVQAIMGLAVAIVRYLKNGLILWQLAIPCVIFGAGGATIGAFLSLQVPSDVLLYLMFVLLPLCAWAVFASKGMSTPDNNTVELTPKLFVIVSAIAFVCGMYDGFYGPGSGTFLVIALTQFTSLGIKHAAAHAKVINFSDNIAAFIVFLSHGRVLVWLGIVAGLCNMLGAWIGSGAVIKNGAKFMKPLLLLALVLLVINLITNLIPA